ncbi:MAG: DUF2029 domain-containing protein [Gemmataceae bacterium]|nr:DUF2029 domain-containing protein [Gemmataceae bacterium]
MRAAVARGFATCSAWLAARPYSILAVVVIGALLVPFCKRADSEWDMVYLAAADDLHRGQDMYAKDNGYLYPPFMALLAVPFTALPVVANRLVWYGINVVALIYLIRTAWQLAGGGALQGPRIANRREHLIFLLGLGCFLGYCLNALSHQQTDLVIGALLLAGCQALNRERLLRAATLLGLAAAMKCTALLWLPFLAWQRRWSAALWLGIVALGVNFLPDIVYPAADGTPWLCHWSARFLEPMTTVHYRPGTWGSDIVYNQSLAGAINRWTTTHIAWTATGLSVEPSPAVPDPMTLRLWRYGLSLVLLGAAALATWPRPDTESGETTPRRCAFEGGLVLALMLLLSPMSSNAHFGILALAAFCVARMALQRGSRLHLFLLGGCLVMNFLRKDLCGNVAHGASLWCGAAMWTALFLGFGCGAALWRRRVLETRLSPAKRSYEYLSRRPGHALTRTT